MRIPWRESSRDSLEEYRLITVTQGTGSAPFQSTTTVHQLSLDEKTEFHLASTAVLRNFHVDDLFSGRQNGEEVGSFHVK